MKKILNTNSINIIVKYMSVIMFLVILLLLIFIDTRVEYNAQYINNQKLDNYICFLIILIITSSIFFIKKIFKDKFNISKTLDKKEFFIIPIIFIILFIFQIIILENIYFETGWDVLQILYTANNYAETGIFQNNNYYIKYPYFDVYQNNVFLASIFGIIIKIAMFFNFSQANKILSIISIILVDIAGIVMVKTIGNFTNRKSLKVISAVLYAVFIGMSPWFLIPYSDTFSIVFPISVLYNYTKKDKKMYNYLLIGLFSYLGYIIKPTSLIILIAIIILELYKTFFRSKNQIKTLIKNTSSLLFGILIVVILNMGLQNIIDYKVDKNYKFSLYHYLMMGMNTKTTGSYSSSDVLNSLSINTYNERLEYNKQVFLQRFKELSVVDHFKFYGKKILLNYNDGTFSWGKEGFFYMVRNRNKHHLAITLKDFFYNTGDLYFVFSSIMQTLWIFIISATLVGALLKKFDHKNSVIYLSIIGLTLFTLIFEARARYLYSYSTFFIILAVLGIEVLYKKIQKES